jgi:hypothetical protein
MEGCRSTATLLRTIQVGECKGFPKGSMWEHGVIAKDYPGKGVQQHSQGRDTGVWRTIQVEVRRKDLSKEHRSMADYPGRRVTRLSQGRDK